MAAKREPTRNPGVYKRGSRYVATWRAGGKQHSKSARTLDAARKLRAAMIGDVARGEFHERSRLTFREYAEPWVERYQGRGGGFRPSTRDDYRRLLRLFTIPWFNGEVVYPRAPSRPLRVSEITPRDVAEHVGWLCDERGQAEHAYRLAQADYRRRKMAGERVVRPRRRDTKRLSDSTIRNVVNPLRSCLRTAVAEGSSVTTRATG